MEDRPGVMAPPPLIYLGGLAVGFGLEALLPSVDLRTAQRAILGPFLLVAGGALMFTFVSAFRRARTPVDPYSATTAIVTSGPYRFTRNPGYLGMALLYTGIALTASAVWALVPLPVVVAIVDRGVIAREERYLEAKFGEEYRRYRARVRRWL